MGKTPRKLSCQEKKYLSSEEKERFTCTSGKERNCGKEGDGIGGKEASKRKDICWNT